MMTRLRTAAKMQASRVSMMELRMAAGICEVRFTMIREATRSAETPRITVGCLASSQPGLPLLPDPALLADLLPEVVQLGPPHPSLAEDLDLLDAGRVQGKRPLHAHPVGNPAHGEGLPDSAAAPADDDPLERLDPLAAPFRHPQVHALGDGDLLHQPHPPRSNTALYHTSGSVEQSNELPALPVPLTPSGPCRPGAPPGSSGPPRPAPPGPAGPAAAGGSAAAPRASATGGSPHGGG